jgi:hypothetical protein
MGREQDEGRNLMARHPGLRDLNDQLEMMKILCTQEEKHK